ncbi:hypothetical protein INR49_029106 [Caranx melampygus]|nr:hypothetical protein INR49_029106 [Caranx melampygus]
MKQQVDNPYSVIAESQTIDFHRKMDLAGCRLALLILNFQRQTYIRGLIAEEIDGVQAFTLQQLQTQSLVPALRKNVKADETT